LFEPIRDDGSVTQLVGAGLAIWRSQWAKRLMVLALVLVLTVLGTWIWFWRATLDADCRAVNVGTFDFDALMDLRARKTAYQRSKELTPWLTLSPEEMTFLMSDSQGVSVELATDGSSELEAFIGYPVTGGCYNLNIKGEVLVENGVLMVNPRIFRMGEYDLSWLLSWKSIEIRPEDLPDKAVAEQLQNTRAMKVGQGKLHLRLKDRSVGWRFRER